MKEYYIGLDVHKDSVFMAVLDDRKVRSNEKSDSGLIGAVEAAANLSPTDKSDTAVSEKRKSIRGL